MLLRASLVLLVLLPLPSAAKGATSSEPPTVAEDAAPLDPDDAVLAAMIAELERTAPLLAAQSPAPYFVSLQVIEQRRAVITGEEGGLQGYRPVVGRWLHADVRVGSPEFDSTHALRDGSWDDADTTGRALPVGEDKGVLQRQIWEELDERYRSAVERFERVEANRKLLVEEETFFDLAPDPPQVHMEPRADLDGLDLVAWEGAVRRASSVFAQSEIAYDPNVSLTAEAETRWFVSSEGDRQRTGALRFRVGITADTIADDGTYLSVHEASDAASAETLISPEALYEQTRAVEQRLRALRTAPEQEPYVGPALLSGRAAAVFFHEIFGHRVEGHRLKQVADAQTFRGRVGEAILPSFLTVVDDPTRTSYAERELRGAYRFDDEGVEARPVTLVRDGVLEGFLQSRSTVGEGALSNAHARRQPGLDPVARQGNLLVLAEQTQPDEELRRALIARAEKAGLPYALYIEDIDGGFTFTDRDIPNAFQIDVLSARRIWTDGRPDELVRGIDLIGTPLQTFALIEAAGDRPDVFNGTCGAESGWVPVSAAAPALLIREIETQRKGKGQSLPPLLPPPDVAALAALERGQDVLLDVLAEEADRARRELRLGEAPAPAWVTIRARDHHTYQVMGDFGTLVSETGRRTRPTNVEVVVGDFDLNSSRFEADAGVALPDAVQRPRLVSDDVPPALARDLWISADAGYKAALQRYALKVAARRSSVGEEPPPDWSAAEPVQAVDRSPVPEPDEELLRRIVLESSAALRAFPAFRRGRVTAVADHGLDLLVDTQGMRLAQPSSHVVIYAFADALRDDGVRVFDRLQWVARTEADLPSVPEIVEAVRAMGADLEARRLAPAVGFYEGPVLFEGEAAADVLRYLVTPEVVGTPPEPEAGQSYAQQTRRGPRLGRRLLPRGWTVVDDPTSAPEGTAGGYRYDLEGVPAQAVQVVEDGRVRELLMTRVPRRGRTGSTGHARGRPHAALSAELSSWTATPKRLLSARAVERMAARLRREAEQEAILVVQRFEQGWVGRLPRPTQAVWRFPDGREVPVTALEFLSVDRRTLRDLVAAGGPLQVVSYLAPGGPGRAGTTSGLPTVLRAPSLVLIDGMETAFPGGGEEPAVLPPPPLELRAP